MRRARSSRSTPRRRTCRPRTCTSATPCPTRRPSSSSATGACAGGTSSTRWASTTTACRPSATSSRSTDRQAPHDALGVPGAVPRRRPPRSRPPTRVLAQARAVGRLALALLDHRRPLPAHRADVLPRPVPEGPRLPLRGTGVLGPAMQTVARAGRPRDDHAQRRRCTTSRSRAPDGRDLVISTTRPELIPSCVALYFHPEDERYASLAGGTRSCRCSATKCRSSPTKTCGTDFGTGLMMVCTFGDGDDVQRWRRDGLDLRLGIDAAGRLTDVAGDYAGLDVRRRAEAHRRPISRRPARSAARRRSSSKCRSASARSDRSSSRCGRTGSSASSTCTDELLGRSAELAWHPDHMKVRLDRLDRGPQVRLEHHPAALLRRAVPGLVLRRLRRARARADEQRCRSTRSRTAPPVDACPELRGRHCTGDPDVMDTWMTSSMTPQINANWARSPIARPPAARR